jgi:exonuclease III
MKGLLWNCRGIRKKGVAPLMRHMISQYKFQFIGLQETMIGYSDDFITRKLDPSGEYLWLWSPAKGKSGGILVGSRIDDLDVGSFKKGNHILQVNYWDKTLSCKWNLMVIYGPAQEKFKDIFLKELDDFCENSREPYIVGGDFNIIRFSYEKIESTPYTSILALLMI